MLDTGELQVTVALKAKVSKSLITKWKQEAEKLKIIGSTPELKHLLNSYKLHKHHSPFQRESDELYKHFVFLRKTTGQEITYAWVQETMLELVKTNRPPGFETFRCSNGWVDRWRKNYRVSSQVRTEKKNVSDLARLQGLRATWSELLTLQRSPGYNPRNVTFGRFGPEQIWNVDQIPLLFVPKRRCSLNPVGETCWIATHGGSGLEKLHATLVLCLRASGEQIVAPMVVFRGQGISYHLREELDAVGIEYCFTPRSWVNEQRCLEHLQKIDQMVHRVNPEYVENLLVLDGLAAQGTPKFMKFALDHNILPFYLPPNATHLLQPIDHHVGAWFKAIMAALYKEHVLVAREQWIQYRENNCLGVPQVRVLLLKWVKIAWESIKSRPDFIYRAFTSTGILMPLDAAKNRIRVRNVDDPLGLH